MGVQEQLLSTSGASRDSLYWGFSTVSARLRGAAQKGRAGCSAWTCQSEGRVEARIRGVEVVHGAVLGVAQIKLGMRARHP